MSDILFKAMPGQVNIDEAKGVVECFVAGVGNKDSVGDVVMPGAFDSSLRRRKPRVVWGHDWNQPIGKVLEIFEVPNSDPRLPMKMKQAGIGGLFARVQFNLRSEKGREAFASVAFFGEDQEWCADTETEILTDRGWLKFNEVTTDDRAYVLDPELGWGKFEQIEAVNIWEAKERQMRFIETGNHSSLTTGAHRWPLASNTNGGNVSWTTTDELKVHDRLIRSAVRSDAPVVQKYTDSFVELVGWFWTEGWVAPADHTDAGLYLAQSTKVNPQHVSSIRAALQSEFPGEWSEKHSSDDMARFRLTRAGSEAIRAVTGEDKEPTPDFLTNLTRSQLLLLIQTCMNGDGHVSKSGQSTWYQVSEKGVRAFEMLCALAGQPTNTMAQKDYGNRFGEPPTHVSLLKTGVAKPLDAIRVKSYKYKEGEPRTPATDEWVTTHGQIWCPTTPSGTWLARRNGTVYFTGNSIGYKTLDAIYDNERKANMLREVELYEVSPVLHGANQLTGTISIKSEKQEDRTTSFKKSKWKMFDREFAQRIREDYPEIWAKGGNIKGNDQYEILTKIAEQGGTATTEDQIKALELREAWVARHEGDFRLAGVVAQMKWLAIGSRGEDHMKKTVNDAIKKMKMREKSLDWDDELDDWDEPNEKGFGSKPGKEKLQALMDAVLKAADELDDDAMLNEEDFSDTEEKDKFWKLRRLLGMSPGSSVESPSMARPVWDDEEDDEMPMRMRKPMGCGCGCGSKNSCVVEDAEYALKFVDDLGIDQKAGRVLSTNNMQKLQNAIDLLKEVLAAGGRQDIEMKEKHALFIDSDTEELFGVKELIDPILDYYDLESRVYENGIFIKSDAVVVENAINTALTNYFSGAIEYKGLGGRIGRAARRVMPSGGRRGRGRGRGLDINANFDPNARDADGDGTLQEGTRFARPATPKKPQSESLKPKKPISDLADEIFENYYSNNTPDEAIRAAREDFEDARRSGRSYTVGDVEIDEAEFNRLAQEMRNAYGSNKSPGRREIRKMNQNRRDNLPEEMVKPKPGVMSPDAEDILYEHYFYNTPEEAIQIAEDTYNDYRERGIPYEIDDRQVTPREFQRMLRQMREAFSLPDKNSSMMNDDGTISIDKEPSDKLSPRAKKIFNAYFTPGGGDNARDSIFKLIEDYVRPNETVDDVPVIAGELIEPDEFMKYIRELQNAYGVRENLIQQTDFMDVYEWDLNAGFNQEFTNYIDDIKKNVRFDRYNNPN